MSALTDVPVACTSSIARASSLAEGLRYSNVFESTMFVSLSVHRKEPVNQLAVSTPRVIAAHQ